MLCSRPARRYLHALFNKTNLNFLKMKYFCFQGGSGEFAAIYSWGIITLFLSFIYCEITICTKMEIPKLYCIHLMLVVGFRVFFWASLSKHTNRIKKKISKNQIADVGDSFSMHKASKIRAAQLSLNPNYSLFQPSSENIFSAVTN